MNLRFLATLGLGLLLAACDGGPSDSDINDALNAQLEQQNALTARAGLSYTLHSSKKQSCSENNQVWECVVAVDLTAPMIGRQTRTAPIRLVKGDDGWTVIQ